MASIHLNIARGNIIYAQFPEYAQMTVDERKRTAFGFLHNRPLLVVSNPLYIFDKVTVVALTTRNRPGFKITLHNGKISRESVIQPWGVYTIPAANVTNVCGSVDPYTLKAVSDAIAYHLGMSDEMPPYLEGVESIYKPTVNSIKNGARVSIAYEDTIRELDADYNLDYKKPEVISSTTAHQVEAPKEEEAPEVVEAIQETEEEEINEPEPVQEKAKVRKYSTTKQILAHLTDDDACKILARTMDRNDFAKKYNCSVFTFCYIRTTIVSKYVNADDINRILGGKIRNWKFLSQCQKIAVSAYIDIKDINVTDKPSLVKYINQTRKKNQIDKTDGRKWRNLKEESKMLTL